VVSLLSGLFLTNSSTESSREHYLCSTTLFFAPLLGIDRLPGCDTREHPLETRLGRSYHSATRRQFLGHLERVGAAAARMSTL
jgi:hypothetical protein